MENTDIARLLFDCADLLDLTGGNPFRIRAFRQAAQVIDTLPQSAARLSREGKLTELPGIGEGIAERIGEIVDHGTCLEYERLAGQVPPGILELLSVEGVGPKTAAAAWKTLGVHTVDDLEQACRDGRFASLPRMGPKRALGILEAIARHRLRSGRAPLHRALPYSDSILGRLRQVPGVVRAELAGSARRRKETVADLDLLVATTGDPASVVRAFRNVPEADRTIATGPTKAAIRLGSGLQVDLRVLPPESFGAALHYFTGSKSHNIALRTRAVRMGLKVSEYGVFDRKGHRLSGEHEEDVFRAVGLPWIPPELREGAGEIEAAEKGRLPRLVEEDDIRGDLHLHTSVSSDGRSSLEEMVGEARSLGRRYIAITDHSRSRPLGLDAAHLAFHAAAIHSVDRTTGGRPSLLAGIEVDILPDGSLDLPEEALAGLDWVVASVHSRHNQPEAEMTARMVRALRSGRVDVLGHPTGRIIGRRDPSTFDLGRVLEAAHQAGAALEVNAMPDRLDLSDKACRAAKEAGVPVVISSDAHQAPHQSNLRFGVWVARRGWLERKDVLNTRTAAAVRHWRAARSS